MCFKFSFDKIKSKSPFLFSDLSLLRFKLEHCPKAPQEGTLELVIFFNQLSVLSMNIGHRVPAPKRFFLCFLPSGLFRTFGAKRFGARAPWRSRRDSNPCYRRERAMSWATGRREHRLRCLLLIISDNDNLRGRRQAAA